MNYSSKLCRLCPRVKPLSVGRFAGVLDYSKMSPVSRFIARCIMMVFGVKEGDYRDWQAIHAWTEDVNAQLTQMITPKT